MRKKILLWWQLYFEGKPQLFLTSSCGCWTVDRRIIIAAEASTYYCFGNENCFGWNSSDDDVILGATLVHLCTFFRDLFILGLKIEWTWHLPTEHFQTEFFFNSLKIFFDGLRSLFFLGFSDFLGIFFLFSQRGIFE